MQTEREAPWSLMYELSEALTQATLDYQKALRTILDGVIRITGAEQGVLLVYNQQGRLETELARDRRKRSLRAPDLDAARPLIEQVCRTREQLCVPGHRESSRDSTEAPGPIPSSPSAMCAPLKVFSRRPAHQPEERRRIAQQPLERIIGILYVERAGARGSYCAADLQVFLTLANQATAVLLNAQLYQLATTDRLTGVHTRRYFEQSLLEELELSLRTRTPVSLLMLDIDQLAKLNDEYGFDTGDEVLRRVVDRIRTQLRGSDLPARYGGEEFAVILPQTDARGARTVAEALRQEVERRPFTPHNLKVTISIGLATCPRHATTAAELVRRADQALFRAQQKSPNRIHSWTAALTDTARRADKLAGLLTGEATSDYRRVALLLESLSVVNAAAELDDLLARVVEAVVKITRADRAVCLVVDAHEQLQVRAACDAQRQPLPSLTDFQLPIAEETRQRDTPFLVAELPDEPKRAGGRGEHSVMCVPVPGEERPLGVLYVDTRQRAASFSQEGLALFESVARQLAAPIRRAVLAQDRRQLREAERRALEQRNKRLEQQNRSLRETLRAGRQLIGDSAAMLDLLEKVRKVASTEAPVLITGESGAGKQRIARAVHELSPHRDGPFVVLDCSAIPEESLEAEIFGVTEDSSGSASPSPSGKFERARRGTLLLKEISQLPPSLHQRLLRILERGGPARARGGVEVRLLTAARRPFEEMVESGMFQRALYDRLSTVTLQVPPLRERETDVLLLAELFLNRQRQHTTRPLPGLSEGAREALLAHRWPGNVRELERRVERASIMCGREEILPEDLGLSQTSLPEEVAGRTPRDEKRPELFGGLPSGWRRPLESLLRDAVTRRLEGQLREPLQESVIGPVERRLLQKAIRAAAGNAALAARCVGMQRDRFCRRLGKCATPATPATRQLAGLPHRWQREADRVLDGVLRTRLPEARQGKRVGDLLEQLQLFITKHVFAGTDGNKSEAARLLGITYPTLIRRLQRLR